MTSSLIRWIGAINTTVGNFLVPEDNQSSIMTDLEKEAKKGPKEYVLASVYPSEEIRNEVVKYLREDY